MKLRRSLVALLLLAGTSPAALAAPATPEGAAALTAALQTYLGKVPGAVTVMPNGETYEVKLDPAPLLAKAKDAKFEAKVTPLVLNVSDLGGGKWKVDQDQPLEVSFKAEGSVSFTMKMESLKGSGVYDTALGAFESATTDVKNMTFSETVTVPDEGTTKVDATIADTHFEQAMQSDGAGGANGTIKYTYGALKEVFNIPANPKTGTPPMDFTLTAASSTNNGTLTGYRGKPLLDLLAFAVAHPDKADIVKDQAALKEKLGAAIPGWLTIEATGDASDLKLQTMVGEFAIPKVGVEAELTGITKQAKLREKITLDDVTTPPGLIPPWATDLVPHKLALDFNVGGVDLETPARMALAKADFAKDPPLPPEAEAELKKALLPNGTFDIGLGPSLIANPLSELTLEGTMSVNPDAPPNAMPAFTSMIGFKGFDALVAALQKVPQEMGAGQAVPALMMARGMAKNEADGALSWKIETGPGGAILVNGNDVSKMGGGQ